MQLFKFLQQPGMRWWLSSSKRRKNVLKKEIFVCGQNTTECG